MQNPNEEAATARSGEDVRWRVGPRWAQVSQLVVAVLFLGLAAFQASLTWEDEILRLGSAFYLIAACAFVMNFVILGGWTSANRNGVATFNGVRRRVVRWSEIERIERRRLGLRVVTRDDRTVQLPGLTRARLGELTDVWSHYGGAELPLAALTRDVRDALWPVEPSDRFRLPGAVLAVVATVGAFLVALVVGLSFAVATANPWWVMIMLVVVLGASILPLLRLSMSGSTLSPQAIRVRLPWSTRTLLWHEVWQVVGAAKYTEIVRHDGTRSILYGIPAEQWHVVEDMRTAARAGPRSD